MDVKDFIVRRIVMQQQRLPGTGKALTVEVGDAYYQMAAYDREQLLVEVTSNQFLPDGAGLDGLDQKLLTELGFEVPSEDWPNWSIRMDDPSTEQMTDAAISLTAALLRVFHVEPQVLLDALLDEFLISHQEAWLDPEWVTTLRSSLAFA